VGATHVAIHLLPASEADLSLLQGENPSRARLARFVEAAAAAAPSGARVLDAGAGDCRYATFFARASYESADFCQVEKTYAPMTYVCDLGQIPVEDERFDVVLCTQVLEHVPNPDVVLGELARVLKPGGTLWLTAPFFYAPHELPHDYYRYTEQGLRWLVERSGLKVVRLEWLEGYYATFAYQLEQAHGALTRRGDGANVGWRARAVIAFLGVVLLPLARFFKRLEFVHKHVTTGICKNHALVAEKPLIASDAGSRAT
jgi:ubiquinone/menaquinone biosynthesis C-methylase UbiE